MAKCIGILSLIALFVTAQHETKDFFWSCPSGMVKAALHWHAGPAREPRNHHGHGATVPQTGKRASQKVIALSVAQNTDDVIGVPGLKHKNRNHRGVHSSQ
jgi:hypothetical protein